MLQARAYLLSTFLIYFLLTIQLLQRIFFVVNSILLFVLYFLYLFLHEIEKSEKSILFPQSILLWVINILYILFWLLYISKLLIKNQRIDNILQKLNISLHFDYTFYNNKIETDILEILILIKESCELKNMQSNQFWIRFYLKFFSWLSAKDFCTERADNNAIQYWICSEISTVLKYKYSL